VGPAPLTRTARESAGGDRFAAARRRMVEDQLVARGIRDLRVLEAMSQVPREAFVDAAFEARAYGDHALPSSEGQTISQPWMVARMLELAGIGAADEVLEIGTGTGYQTALLSRLAARVFSVERVASLMGAARTRLEALGVRNAMLQVADGSLGWQEFAPYARVLVAAGAPHVPEALKRQLRDGGVLVIPVGSATHQHLEVWRRLAGDRWEHERRGECRFVPLLGRDAWRDAPPSGGATTE